MYTYFVCEKNMGSIVFNWVCNKVAKFQESIICPFHLMEYQITVDWGHRLIKFQTWNHKNCLAPLPFLCQCLYLGPLHTWHYSKFLFVHAVLLYFTWHFSKPQELISSSITTSIERRARQPTERHWYPSGSSKTFRLVQANGAYGPSCSFLHPRFSCIYPLM